MSCSIENEEKLHLILSQFVSSLLKRCSSVCPTCNSNYLDDKLQYKHKVGYVVSWVTRDKPDWNLHKSPGPLEEVENVTPFVGVLALFFFFLFFLSCFSFLRLRGTTNNEEGKRKSLVFVGDSHRQREPKW